MSGVGTVEGLTRHNERFITVAIVAQIERTGPWRRKMQCDEIKPGAVARPP
jgi:hypothetical protein